MPEISQKEMSSARKWLVAKLRDNKGQRITEALEITPARAAAILENNPKNRNLSPSVLDQLTSDMRHGRFQADNGETLIIAETGELNDGQHRLTAVVKSGQNLTFDVAFGRKRDSRLTVDTGIKRTTGHMLSFMGMSAGNTIAAAAKRVVSYRQTGAITGTGRVSNAQALEMVAKDELLVEVGTWAHANAAPFKGLKLPPSEIATAYYLFAEVAPMEAKNFFVNLKDGLGLTKGSPIATLLTKLRSSPRLRASERFELLVRCWNFWIRDESIDRYAIMGRVPTIMGPKNGKSNDTQTALAEGEEADRIPA